MEGFQPISGVVTPLLTQYSEDGVVDVSAVSAHTQYLVDAGVDGVFVCGTTGEFLLLEVAERQAIANSVRSAVNGRVPVIIHATAANLRDTLELVDHGLSIGADAFAIMSPWYYKYSDDQVSRFVGAVAERAADKAIYLYNIPARTGNDMTPNLVTRLMAEYPNIVGLKNSQEDASRVTVYSEMLSTNFLVGSDELFFYTLLRGGDGVVSGASNVFPEVYVQLKNAFARGDYHQCVQYQRIIHQFGTLFSAGDISRLKAGLEARGLGRRLCREPQITLDEESYVRFQAEFHRLNWEI